MDAGPSRRGADAGAGNGHYQSPPLCNYHVSVALLYGVRRFRGALLGSPEPERITVSFSLALPLRSQMSHWSLRCSYIRHLG